MSVGARRFTRARKETLMIDVIYVGLTLVAFAAFVAYTLGCAILGQEESVEQQERP